MRYHYQSYLLRIWMPHDASLNWRLQLEDSLTGEQKGFASVADLSAFLIAEMARLSAGEENLPGPTIDSGEAKPNGLI